MVVRWIDLGCPIDLHPQYDPQQKPEAATSGYLADDHRPTLVLTWPAAGNNPSLSRLLLGLFDHESGLDMQSLSVTADFPIDGAEPGTNLATKFESLPGSRWELKLAQPLDKLPAGTLTVSIADRQGNVARVNREFSVGR